MKPKQFQAATIRRCIIPDKRRVVLQNVGAGLYLVIMAETDKGELKPTAPFTLFLQRRDFVPTHWK